MEYEEMLKKGRENLPETVVKVERFEIPKVKGHIQGNKTVITNFNQITDVLHADKQHFLKFLLKELAAPGHFDGPRLILGRKVSSSLINSKIMMYAENYILCSTCGKPDTKIITKEGVNYLKCAACGVQRPVKL